MDENMNMPGIGKRMPYKAPDGVFNNIERNVLNATGCAQKPPRKLRMVGIALGVAASLALIATFAWHRQSVRPDSLAEVRQAFSDLDNADREFLSDIYAEDIFMNINY